MKKYDNHPIVVLIRNNVANNESFEFHPVSPNDVWNESRQIDNSKKTNGCISVDILKLISDLSHTEITRYLNAMLLTSSLYKSSESACKVKGIESL